MSCVAAIQEMLLHVRRGVTHVFPAVPERWREASFRDFRTEGAFLVSAERVAGRTRAVRALSLKGGTLRLADPWADPLRRPAGSA